MERPRPSTYVEDWIRYWGNMGTTYTSRFQRASQDARRGRYTPNRLFSDAVAVWAEGVEAWWAAILGRGVREPAVILFNIPHGTESKQRTVRIPVPGDGLPVVTDLERVNGYGSISKKHLSVLVSDLHDAITVKLIDLTKLPPLVAGQYVGVVHVDERPLVMIHAIVEPAPPPHP